MLTSQKNVPVTIITEPVAVTVAGVYLQYVNKYILVLSVGFKVFYESSFFYQIWIWKNLKYFNSKQM